MLPQQLAQGVVKVFIEQGFHRTAWPRWAWANSIRR
jgi:hypothetical protein